MADSIIVDSTGKPFKKAELSNAIASASMTGVRNIWGFGSEANYITPARLGSILRDAAEGNIAAYLTLAEEMEEKDLHYSSVLGTRKRAISGLPIVVEAASDESKDVQIADAVRDMVRMPEFLDARDELLDAIGKGFSVVELNWDTTAKPWRPQNRRVVKQDEWDEEEGYIWRDPRFFTFDKETGRKLRLLDEENSYDGMPLTRYPYRFMVHKPRLKCGLPIRGGLARLVAIGFMCKSYSITDWMAFAEVFGMPLRVGRYGSGATEDDIATLVSAVANIGTDAAAVIPDSMRIDFEQAGNTSGGDVLFKNLAEFWDKQISKAVLGQTASSEGTPGQLGNNEAQDEVRADILESDAKQLDNTINRDLVKAFVDLNFGPQENYPRVIHQIIEPEDIKALVEAIDTLLPYGLQVEESFMRDKLGIPDPAKGAVLLRPVQPQQPPVPQAMNHQHHNCQHCQPLHTARNRESQPDIIDSLGAEALQDWQQQMNPLLEPIRELLDASETAEEFAQGLAEIMEEMDDTALVKALADRLFKSYGIGSAQD